ncbi:uncharacterized protein C1orf232 homolog isoform X2 [Ascaphus truei]|uniref:uncharacterized protein C1orf232 homolog isoform X2 n=1 Tax=Ascaphus truei TaxID=8439 RepID=UPI003F59A43C
MLCTLGDALHTQDPLPHRTLSHPALPPTSEAAAMSQGQGFWKVYKAKVLQTFNAEQEGEAQEESYTAEVIEPDTPDVEDEGLNMSHLARKVQGALGWRSVTSLFSKEEEQRPEQGAEQPSASCPSEATPHERSSSGLWDVFANRWQQSSVEPPEPQGVLAEPPEEHSEAQYPEEMPFKWGFLTSKLAELRGKSD